MGKTSLKVEMMVQYLKENPELDSLSTLSLRAFLFKKFKCSRYMANTAIKKWKDIGLEFSILSGDKFLILSKIKGCSPREAAEIELRDKAQEKGYTITEITFDPDKGLIVGKLKSLRDE
jgi:hypothetical protein